MPKGIGYDRRRLLGTAALAIGAAGLGVIGCGVQDMTAAAARLPVEGDLPSLGGASAWLNSPPLKASALRGKVVLVDFCTYTCINWLRTLPYVRAWGQKYADRAWW